VCRSRPTTFKKNEIIEVLEALMSDDIAGCPVSSKKWSRRSTYNLSNELKDLGIDASPSSVGNILKSDGFSLKSNRKSISTTHHPDQNRQFEIICETRKHFEDTGQPIISIDTKKKEPIGNFKNPGKIWCREADEVLDHDFNSLAIGRAVPYGIYEPIYNHGTVIVGNSYDTAEFAIDCIELWLNDFAPARYNNIKELLILCDGGGSNGSRVNLWKYKLNNEICKKYGITVHVCHYPLGSSKWNPIEHSLFSPITNNWQGRPLRSFEIVMDSIRSTTNKKGLSVEAVLNTKEYQKGIKLTKEQIQDIDIMRYAELPQWNYAFAPASSSNNAN
jgi:hypothetical protein